MWMEDGAEIKAAFIPFKLHTNEEIMPLNILSSAITALNLCKISLFKNHPKSNQKNPSN